MYIFISVIVQTHDSHPARTSYWCSTI